MESDYKIVCVQKRRSAKEYPYRAEAGYYDVVHKGTGIGMGDKDAMCRSYGEAVAYRRVMDNSAGNDD